MLYKYSIYKKIYQNIKSYFKTTERLLVLAFSSYLIFIGNRIYFFNILV